MGFEPTCPLLAGKTLSRRPRYDRFGTSPAKRTKFENGKSENLPSACLLVPSPTEEVAHDGCALFGKHARDNLHLVIELRVVEDREG